VRPVALIMPYHNGSQMKKFLFLVLFFSSSVSATTFTEPQRLLLLAAAQAEPTIQTCLTAGDDGCVANWFNSVSTFIVWKNRQLEDEVYAQAGFDFTLVDGLTVGKRDEWSNFIFKQSFCNPSKANIRAGVVDVWSGTAAKNAVQAVILGLFKRSATQAEKALATGTGTTAIPGTLGFEGQIQVDDIAVIVGR
jgi:hypothetical protein